MNQARRKRIKEASDKLEDLMIEIGELAEEEQDALQNMPESLQESDKAYQMQAYIDTLENASNDLEPILDSLIDIIS